MVISRYSFGRTYNLKKKYDGGQMFDRIKEFPVTNKDFGKNFKFFE